MTILNIKQTMNQSQNREHEFIKYVEEMLMDYEINKELITVASTLSKKLNSLSACDPVCRIVITFVFLNKFVSDHIFSLDWICCLFNIDVTYFKKIEIDILKDYLNNYELFHSHVGLTYLLEVSP